MIVRRELDSLAGAPYIFGFIPNLASPNKGGECSIEFYINRKYSFDAEKI